MKKILLVSGAMAILMAGMQSCAPQRKMPRPQRNPTPPGKFVKQITPATNAHTVVLHTV